MIEYIFRGNFICRLYNSIECWAHKSWIFKNNAATATATCVAMRAPQHYLTPAEFGRCSKLSHRNQ